MRWYQAYTELNHFITGNREIKIDSHVIAIPQQMRPEFYRLFDGVRTAFIEEEFPRLLDESRRLSESYTKVEEEVIDILRLDDVSMAPCLHRFLREPKNQLIRGLFDLLFDVLKGKKEVETFRQEASRSIEESFKGLYQSGYEKWVALSLVRLLEPHKTFHIPLPQPTSKEIIKRLPTSREPVPVPEESDHLSFNHETMPILIVPDFIVYSVKVDTYIAVRSEFENAMWTAANISREMDWHAFDAISGRNGPLELKPSLILWVADHPEDLALIADSRRVLRPDLIVECIVQKNWYKENGLENVKLRHDVLRPKFGTYVVTREPVPEQVREELGVHMHLLTGGFDRSKLDPISDILGNHRS